MVRLKVTHDKNYFTFIVTRKKTHSAGPSKGKMRKYSEHDDKLASRDTVDSDLSVDDSSPSKEESNNVTLVIHNLDDVDEEMLKNWMKTVTGFWPLSIHMSENEDKAIVKVVADGESFSELILSRLNCSPTLINYQHKNTASAIVC